MANPNKEVENTHNIMRADRASAAGFDPPLIRYQTPC